MLETASAQASLASKLKRFSSNEKMLLSPPSHSLLESASGGSASEYLQAGDGQTSSVVRHRGYRDSERRVWDVLVIKFDGNLIVTWNR